VASVFGASLPYLGTAVVVLAVGLPTMILPFWPDQAIFALIGKTIWNGGFPFVDAWDQKPPSIYFIYAVAIHGPFDLVQNVRAFDLAWTTATVVVLCELGRRWWNLRAGVLAGLGYGVVYVTMSGGWARLAQPDSFIGLPLALALLVYELAHGRRGMLVIAGALLGFAFELRFIMALLVPVVPFVELAATPPAGRVRLWLHRMGWLGVGFAAFHLALALYLLVGGALGAYVDATRFAAGYTRAGWPWQGPAGPTLGEYLTSLRFGYWGWARERLVLTGPAAIGGIVGSFLLHERRVQQLVLFAVLAYAGIAVQAKFFPYHYTYMLTFLALLSGWTWDSFFRLLSRAQPRPVAATAGSFAALALLLYTPEVLDNGWRAWRTYSDYYRRPATRPLFIGSFEGVREARDLAAELRRRTGPGEFVYVWGFDPVIYLLADRPSASRFIYSYPLTAEWAPRAWQTEFMHELEERPPAYFVAPHAGGTPDTTAHALDAVDFVGSFPVLHQWLVARYQFEAKMNGYLVFRRSE
jgi:hypothetical protein